MISFLMLDLTCSSTALLRMSTTERWERSGMWQKRGAGGRVRDVVEESSGGGGVRDVVEERSGGVGPGCGRGEERGGGSGMW